MKLSIISDEYSQDLLRVVSFAREYRLDGIEIRTMEGLPPEEMSDTQLTTIRRTLAHQGLAVSDLASSFAKCTFTQAKEDSKALTEKFEKLIHAASLLEVRSIRCFTFLSDHPGQVTSRQVLQEIAAWYQPFLEKASSEGVRLLFECDPSVTVTDHRQLASFLEMLDSPAAGAIYDPGNDIYDPQKEIPYPDGLEAIKPYLAHVHIKDAVLTGQGPVCVKVGTGSVDFKGILQALKELGYQDYLSLETHYRKVTGSRTAITGDLLTHPGGSSFSAGGEDACRESMSALKGLVTEAFYD